MNSIRSHPQTMWSPWGGGGTSKDDLLDRSHLVKRRQWGGRWGSKIANCTLWTPPYVLKSSSLKMYICRLLSWVYSKTINLSFNGILDVTLVWPYYFTYLFRVNLTVHTTLEWTIREVRGFKSIFF